MMRQEHVGSTSWRSSSPAKSSRSSSPRQVTFPAACAPPVRSADFDSRDVAAYQASVDSLVAQLKARHAREMAELRDENARLRADKQDLQRDLRSARRELELKTGAARRALDALASKLDSTHRFDHSATSAAAAASPSPAAVRDNAAPRRASGRRSSHSDGGGATPELSPVLGCGAQPSLSPRPSQPAAGPVAAPPYGEVRSIRFDSI